MKRTVIAPIIALACLAFNSTLHVNIGTELQDALINAVFTIATLIGIFTNHKKEGE